MLENVIKYKKDNICKKHNTENIFYSAENSKNDDMSDLIKSLALLSQLYTTKRNAKSLIYNHYDKIKYLNNDYISINEYLSPGEDIINKLKVLLENNNKVSLFQCNRYINRLLILINNKVHDLWRIDQSIDKFSSFNVSVFTGYCLLNELLTLLDYIKIVNNNNMYNNISSLQSYRSMLYSCNKEIQSIHSFINIKVDNYLSNVITSIINKQNNLYYNCRPTKYISIGNIIVNSIISPIVNLIDNDYSYSNKYLNNTKHKIKSLLICLNILHTNSLKMYINLCQRLIIKINLSGIFMIHKETVVVYKYVNDLKSLDIFKNQKNMIDLSIYTYIETLLKFCMTFLYVLNRQKNLHYNKNKVIDIHMISNNYSIIQLTDSTESANNQNDITHYNNISDQDKCIWKSKLKSNNNFLSMICCTKTNNIMTLQDIKITYDNDKL